MSMSHSNGLESHPNRIGPIQDFDLKSWWMVERLDPKIGTQPARADVKLNDVVTTALEFFRQHLFGMLFTVYQANCTGRLGHFFNEPQKVCLIGVS